MGSMKQLQTVQEGHSTKLTATMFRCFSQTGPLFHSLPPDLGESSMLMCTYVACILACDERPGCRGRGSVAPGVNRSSSTIDSLRLHSCEPSSHYRFRCPVVRC